MYRLCYSLVYSSRRNVCRRNVCKRNVCRRSVVDKMSVDELSWNPHARAHTNSHTYTRARTRTHTVSHTPDQKNSEMPIALAIIIISVTSIYLGDLNLGLLRSVGYAVISILLT